MASTSVVPQSQSLGRALLGSLTSVRWSNIPLTFAYASAVFVGAFLVFQVQPVISKCVLPWFGGTPAVWTTCMLFFQVLLFAGYLYAHLIRCHLSSRMQGLVHLILLAVASVCLPIQPSDLWKPVGEPQPTWALLRMLAAHVALPYFVLSSTGPLVQSWLSRESRSRSVYRLYALSNVGSLGALVSYPFLFEPNISVGAQARLWGWLFYLFAVVMAILCLRRVTQGSVRSQDGSTAAGQSTDNPVVSDRRNLVVWIGMPTIASAMLLAVTNHVCQDLAVVPLLWIIPLSLYLISFIITFDSPTWYRRGVIAWMSMLGLVMILTSSYFGESGKLLLDGGGYLILLFGVCLICHGEVARCQPQTERLTAYYVYISLGGACGGLLVALVCPLVFCDFRELSVITIVAAGLSLYGILVPVGDAPASRRAPAIGCILGLTLGCAAIANLFAQPDNNIVLKRNFFGVLRVIESDSMIQLVHGRITHGQQFTDHRSSIATSYYGVQSGIGRTLSALQRDRCELNVGVVGLGCGVLATYGRMDEHWDFFEINPDVIEIANKRFTFLQDCDAQLELHLGDGRLLLERSEPASYDLLVIDAFSSDSIPAHLLTMEAIALYRSRLSSGGILAIHISNNHLDLAPLVHRMAAESSLQSVRISSTADPLTGTKAADWVLMTEMESSNWLAENIQEGHFIGRSQALRGPLWTDQNHDLLSVVRW